MILFLFLFVHFRYSNTVEQNFSAITKNYGFECKIFFVKLFKKKKIEGCIFWGSEFFSILKLRKSETGDDRKKKKNYTIFFLFDRKLLGKNQYHNAIASW